ncbi:MAG: hypothetical protein HYR85_22105 [Planctomycetes bacterium]|nr:hypothetical protein [Planctomycetota bacterium]
MGCRLERLHGAGVCDADCPAREPRGPFRYVRIERADAIPPADPHAVDVAILDMNHGWPNIGHDSLVHGVLEIACDLKPELDRLGFLVRALSYDVRRGGVVPDPPGGRFSVYVGTGGPGHIDPSRNDGVSEGTQGIVEDPSWEKRAFALFDAIRDDSQAALLAVCHTFGVMCRWSGIAHPALRGAEKGGKSTGLLENVLTDDALAHPWFDRFSKRLPDGRRLRIIDNRLYDLIPERAKLPAGMTALGFEAGGGGAALTMVEFARDAAGTMPRIFGVNHHPEVVDRPRQLGILRQKFRQGEVTQQWYEERAEILMRTFPGEDIDERLHLTSAYTLLAPLRFHVYRQVRRRAEALGLQTSVHENEVIRP